VQKLSILIAMLAAVAAGPAHTRACRWKAFAPMMTPRHGLGAVALGDWILVAGGGPVMGGGIQSAVHEGFTLG
jgi:hypothetical protein